VLHKSIEHHGDLRVDGRMAAGAVLGALASLVTRKARGGEEVKFRKRSELTLESLMGFAARDKRIKGTKDVALGRPLQRLFSFRNREFWDYRTNPVQYFRKREWEKKDKLYMVLFLLMHAGAFAAPFFFTWNAFALFLGLYCLNMLGITVSYHRQLSHQGFKSPKFVEYFWAYLGMCAVQGHPIKWVLWHRQHHATTDQESDVHSPRDGFWWSHMGWELQSKDRWIPPLKNTVKDLESQWFYRHVAKFYHIYSIVIPIVVLAKLGGWPFVLWGFFARVVAGFHVTGAVNSVCHVWGFQDWKSNDLSMNNWLIGLLAMGEGWHNNHHAFEQSVRHGLKWWQVDVTWYVIVAMEKLGLAWDLKYPSESKMRRLALNGEETLRAHGVRLAPA
jgi:stearoyl-CoA desaturase (delta-9 desaturase)